jgi:hypothetical protein
MGSCGSPLQCDLCYDPTMNFTTLGDRIYRHQAPKVNCSVTVTQLEADADIVGVGVLLSNRLRIDPCH